MPLSTATATAGPTAHACGTVLWHAVPGAIRLKHTPHTPSHPLEGAGLLPYTLAHAPVVHCRPASLPTLHPAHPSCSSACFPFCIGRSSRVLLLLQGHKQSKAPYWVSCTDACIAGDTLGRTPGDTAGNGTVLSRVAQSAHTMQQQRWYNLVGVPQWLAASAVPAPPWHRWGPRGPSQQLVI